jgi:hypothetical protein
MRKPKCKTVVNWLKHGFTSRGVAKEKWEKLSRPGVLSPVLGELRYLLELAQ